VPPGNPQQPILELPYTDDELFATGPQKTYTGAHLNEIAFPLGGIGAGCVSLSGRGALVDWEIFNRPNKGYRPSYTFLSLFAESLTPPSGHPSPTASLTPIPSPTGLAITHKLGGEDEGAENDIV
jgi:hypothetical protein